jgi:hypothetical protein
VRLKPAIFITEDLAMQAKIHNWSLNSNDEIIILSAGSLMPGIS